MSKSATVRILQVALTPEERQALDVIAETEHVSMSAIVRDLLAEKYPETFGAVHRPRSGYGGVSPRETTS